MKRTIARALRKLANRLDPSRGWTVTTGHGSAARRFGEAGAKAANEFRHEMQSRTGFGGLM